MNRHRLIALIIAVVAALVASIWFTIDRRVYPHLTAGPMLQNVTTDGFTVIWRMDPSQPVAVQVMADDDTLIQSVPAGREGLEPSQYAAVVGQLAAGERYQYQLVCRLPAGGERVLAQHRVQTAPPAGRPFRFLAFGDGGVGTPTALRLARRMADYTPDLIIHTGDVIYPRGAPDDFYPKFYLPYAHLIAESPIYLCLGNHEFRTDEARPALDVFVLPENGPDGVEPERFYWFDYGDVRFVALDSNQDLALYRDAVAGWLEDVLATAGDRWKIVFFHEPVFTNGRHPPADKLIETIVPVLDRHRVELVLNGHNHLYERTYPIRHGQVVPAGEGTVHVITGAGGANLYETLLPLPPFLAVSYDRQHSFTVADVTPEALRLRQIGLDGTVIDQHDIARPTTRPANDE